MVYYKQNDDDRWHGPGVVIGKDGKHVIVNHGGVYVRVHIFWLQHAKNSENQDVVQQLKSRVSYNTDEKNDKVSILVEPEYEYEVKPAGSQENHTQDINNSLMFQGDLPDSNLNDKIGD